jgi:hypothetical protein
MSTQTEIQTKNDSTEPEIVGKTEKTLIPVKQKSLKVGKNAKTATKRPKKH